MVWDAAKDAVAKARKQRDVVLFVAHVVTYVLVLIILRVVDDEATWWNELMFVWLIVLVGHLAVLIYVTFSDIDVLTDADNPQETITRALFVETEAMIRWGLASGQQVPTSAVEATRAFRDENPRLFETPELDSNLSPGDAVRAQRAAELKLWATPPPRHSVESLTRAHNLLTKLVAPASPRSVKLIYYGRRNRLFPFLGPIKLIRHMAYVAVLLLALVVALTIVGRPFQDNEETLSAKVAAAADEVVAAAEDITAAAEEAGPSDDAADDPAAADAEDVADAATEVTTAADAITEAAMEITADPASVAGEIDADVQEALGDDSGTRAALVVYLLANAGLGAAFFAMWKANRYVRNATYDPIYEPTYWIRFVLGLVGGFVLAVVVRDAFPDLKEIAAPILAIVGGFSADVVYRILQRVVDTVDALVRGSSQDRVDAQARSAQAIAATEQAETRIALAGQLVQLQTVLKQAGAEAGSEEVSAMLDELMPIEINTRRAAAVIGAVPSGSEDVDRNEPIPDPADAPPDEPPPDVTPPAVGGPSTPPTPPADVTPPTGGEAPPAPEGG